MSDLFLGQTCTYGAKFISAGTAHTFTFPFQVDKVTFWNYTKFGTDTADPVSVWFRGFPAADALQWQAVAAGGAPTMLLTTSNGFTVADTDGGVPSFRASINAISMVNPVAITTTSAHGYQTDQIVRITNLGNAGAVNYGADQLNNNRYKITVTGATTFTLQDPITGEDIDGTGFTAYISGGSVNLETRVISLNNPQVSPYAVTPYVPNPFEYDPIEYKLTAGTAVMGADGDQYYIEAIKFGQYVDLGDLLV